MNNLKAAMDKIQTIDMFSKDGWEEVHKACKGVTTDSDDIELANGFIDFTIVWFKDNNIGDLDGVEEQNIHDLLLPRYTDYLIHD